MCKNKIKNKIICVCSLFVIFSILTGCSSSLYNYSEEQEYLMNTYIKRDAKMDPSVSSVFIDFEDIDNYAIDSDKTLRTAHRIQEWLDLNSNVEVIGMIGPVEQKGTTGFYITYKNSDKSYNYYVFLSHDNYAYLGYCACIFIDNTFTSTSDDYYYFGIGKREDSNKGESEVIETPIPTPVISEENKKD